MTTAKQRNAMQGAAVDSYTHREMTALELAIRAKVQREMEAVPHEHAYGGAGRCVICRRHREPARVSP